MTAQRLQTLRYNMQFLLEKRKPLTLTALAFLAVFLTLFNFNTTPKVWVDEGVFTEVSRNFEKHGVLGIQTEPSVFYKTDGFVLSTSYPVIFPIALSFKIFDVGLLQARIPMLIYILLFLFVSFLFVNKKYGHYPAVFSVLLLLTFSPLYGNGRPVQGEVPGLFFLILGAYLLTLLEESVFVSRKWAVLAGLALGFSSATKAIYLTFVSLALIIGCILWWKKVENKKSFVFLWLGYLAPVFLWFYIHFPTPVSVVEIIKSYLYFAGNHGSEFSTIETIYHNFLRFFTEATPILFLLVFTVSILYFFIKSLKEKSLSVSMPEFVLLLFIILNLVGYLKGTGWYRYFFPANAVAYLFFPVAVISFSNFFENKNLKRLLYLVPVILLIIQSYHLIFLSDTSLAIKRTRNLELASLLENLDKSKNILFYNSIETIVFYKGSNYSQYLQMDDFLVAGDVNSINNSSYNYILTDDSSGGIVSLSCYRKTQVSSYYLFEKEQNCKPNKK